MSTHTIALTLCPTPGQAAALDRLQDAFAAACNHISAVAWTEREFNKVRLQRLVYCDVRARFGLLAQHTIRAIAVVAAAAGPSPNCGRSWPTRRGRRACPWWWYRRPIGARAATSVCTSGRASASAFGVSICTAAGAGDADLNAARMIARVGGLCHGPWRSGVELSAGLQGCNKPTAKARGS